MNSAYRITMTVTRVTTYETVIHADSPEAAQEHANYLVPDDMEEVDQETTDMSTTTEPVTD